MAVLGNSQKLWIFPFTPGTSREHRHLLSPACILSRGCGGLPGFWKSISSSGWAAHGELGTLEMFFLPPWMARDLEMLKHHNSTPKKKKNLHDEAAKVFIQVTPESVRESGHARKSPAWISWGWSGTEFPVLRLGKSSLDLLGMVWD